MTNYLKSIFRPLWRFYKRKMSQKRFNANFLRFQELASVNPRLPVRQKDMYPCLFDDTGVTFFDAHYIYHPAWAARVIREIQPLVHIDISSTLHFCSILSAFVPTIFYDYRPAHLELDQLESLRMDLTDMTLADNSVISLSCLHTIEHIGLGRYGDPLNPDGDLAAINELKRVCAKGGSLLVAVPVGDQRVMFNAHRIYDAVTFAGYFNGFTLKEFSLITDDDKFKRACSLEDAIGQTYGCGCFWFVKN